MAYSTTNLIATIRKTANCPERAILDLGWTQGEIDAAVAAGLVRRIGSQMGLSTIRYLRAA